MHENTVESISWGKCENSVQSTESELYVLGSSTILTGKQNQEHIYVKK